MSGRLDPASPGVRRVSRGRTITESDVAQFAALTGDTHPQHTDAVWAAGSSVRANPKSKCGQCIGGNPPGTSPTM